ncbi:hypothetical protein [Streptomyces sp. L-9-10]|uniref:hypothetical protein n=1 Tax=Streptomyces sp. L-9-10 TaxID=1478131 RepID=UPI00101D8CF0|nr:hypothetical protein [Streptomyces sp. L-9-10]
MIRTRAMRTAMTAAVVLLAFGGPATVPAQATTGFAAAPATSRAEAPAATPATTQVDTFLKAYRRAVLGQSGEDPRAVRERLLSSYLNLRLDAWAEQNDADPVFRAQNVPAKWSAHQIKQEAGFASVRLTETWTGGGVQEVWYTVRVADLRIVDLGDRPAF